MNVVNMVTGLMLISYGIMRVMTMAVTHAMISNIVHPSIASKAFNNYLLERNVIRSPALFEAIRVHGLISYQRELMNQYVLEELISVVMHPSRIRKQMDQYDDIEDFFDAIGC